MRKGDKSNEESSFIILAVILILVILAGFLVLKITGKMIYGEPLGAQVTGGTMTHDPTAPTPSDAITLTATVAMIGDPPVTVEMEVNGFVVNTCPSLGLGETCVISYAGGTFADGSVNPYRAFFTDALLNTYITPLESFSVVSVCGDLKCDGISEDPTTCSADCESCSDGLITGGEECDDGNLLVGDGCSDTCTIEFGYECSGEPSICGLKCGNGICDLGEDHINCLADCPAPAPTSSGGGGGTNYPPKAEVFPVDGSLNVPVDNLQIEIKFSERMDYSTINLETIKLVGPNGAVPLIIGYNSVTYTATASVVGTLLSGVVYTVHLSEEMKDSSGKKMTEEYTSQFVTAGAESGGEKTGSLELVEENGGTAALEGKLTVVETPASASRLLLVPALFNLKNVFCNSPISNIFFSAFCAISETGADTADSSQQMASEEGFAPDGERTIQGQKGSGGV